MAANRNALTEAIEQLQAAGFDVRESLIGWFTVSPELLDASGEIGEDYCWMHQPGGWTCRECQAALKEVH